ncbi:MAG: hypothetical protein ACLFQ6_08160 [Candidatus Sumerlaeia bacterium]
MNIRKTCRACTHFMLVLCLILFISGLTGQAANAQSIIEQYGAMGAANELNNQQVGGGGSGAVNRARGAAGQQGANNPFDIEDPDPNQDFYGPDGPGNMAAEGQYYDPAMQGFPGMEGYEDFEDYAPQQPVFEYTPPEVFPAIEGRRVYDAVSYRLNPGAPRILDDPKRKRITEENLDAYSDDGKTQGDQEANDGLYSKITTTPSTDDWTGGLSHLYATKLINMLSAAEDMDPLIFFGMNAITNDRFSSLPQERDKVQQRNNWIHKVEDGDYKECWTKRFLDIYRINQGDPESDFFPLYVPEPPPRPAVLPPPGWRPIQGIQAPEEVRLEQAFANFREEMAEQMTEQEIAAAIRRLEARFDEEEGGDEALQQFLDEYGPAETQDMFDMDGMMGPDGGMTPWEGEAMGWEYQDPQEEPTPPAPDGGDADFGENSRGYYDTDPFMGQ